MNKFVFISIRAVLLAIGIILFLVACVVYQTWVPMISLWSLLFLGMSVGMCYNPHAISDPFGDATTSASDVGFFFAGIFFVSAFAPLVVMAHVNKLLVTVLDLAIVGGFAATASMLMCLGDCKTR